MHEISLPLSLSRSLFPFISTGSLPKYQQQTQALDSPPAACHPEVGIGSGVMLEIRHSGGSTDVPGGISNTCSQKEDEAGSGPVAAFLENTAQATP